MGNYNHDKVFKRAWSEYRINSKNCDSFSESLKESWRLEKELSRKHFEIDRYEIAIFVHEDFTLFLSLNECEGYMERRVYVTNEMTDENLGYIDMTHKCSHVKESYRYMKEAIKAYIEEFKD